MGKDLELLRAVLERARVVATRLEDEDADEELMAKQCWQDRDDFSCASLCDLRERANSSASGGDVGNIADLANFSPASSPRSGSPRSPRSISPSSSPPSSPRGVPTPLSPTSGSQARSSSPSSSPHASALAAVARRSLTTNRSGCCQM